MKSTLLPLLPLLMMASNVSANTTASQVVNEGGLRIFQAVESRNKGNICLSPYSIQSALAMTYAGAEGTTLAQMGEVLEFPKNPTDLASVIQGLNAALKTSADTSGKDISLNIANRLFGAAGFSFRVAFLDLLKTQFSAPLEELDFKKSPSKAADFINQWVEKQTEKRIQNLIPKDALTEDTTMVLVNALYLKIPWAQEFNEGATQELPFQADGRTKVNVPTMMRTDSFGYMESEGFQVVGIPFRGGQFQFLVLLPEKAGSTELPSATLLEKCAKLPGKDVKLFLPKFKLQPPTISLGDALKSLGMNSAFDVPQGSANFNGMAPRKPDDYLFISDVFHKTFFALDEKGVEAAAATAVVMMRATAMPVRREPVEVHVDRPFFFAIQHNASAACLFFGKVTDPR